MAKLRAGRGIAVLDTECQTHLVTVDNLLTGEVVRLYCYIGDEESCIMDCCNDQDSRFYPFQIKPYERLVTPWLVKQTV